MKNNFKIRCSAIGQIMTNPKSKAEILSQTAKTYMETWAKEQIYDKRKEIKSKYFDKGNECEAGAIELIAANLYDNALLIKNEKYFEDDFMTGTPDLIFPDLMFPELIIDTKVSWDCFTFPLFAADLPEKDYYWQMQGYMNLVNIRKASVIYALMDTPEEIVEKELKYHFWDTDEWDTEQEELIRAKHRYSDVPIKYRIKRFDVYRNDEDIEAIKNRVLECRIYIDSL